VMQPTLFLLNSLFLLVLCVLLGALLSFSGLYFHVLSISSIKWFYLGTLLVPLAPIIMTFREIVHYTIQELKKYRQLKDSVLDFEKFRKESGRRS